MTIQLAKNAPAGKHVRVLVYGDTGTGKTSWAARSPRPLVLLTEPQGAVSVAQWAPEAQVLVIEDTKTLKAAWESLVRTAQHRTLREALAAQAEGKLSLPWPVGEDELDQPCCLAKIGQTWVVFQTLVIDSLTDLQRVVMDPEDHSDGALRISAEEAPKSSYDDWRRTQQAILGLLRNARTLPCHLVVTALAEVSEEKRTEPALQGKMVQPTVGQFFNAVGLARVGGSGELKIQWKQTVKAVTKPAGAAWPEVSYHDATPGKGTLGSMALKLLGEGVAANPEDAANLAAGSAPSSPASPARR